MTATVNLDPDSVTIELSGIDALLCLKRKLRLDRSNVEPASVASVQELKRNRGWRIAGGYFSQETCDRNPSLPKRHKGRQFSSVSRDQQVLRIDLKSGPLRRVVLQTPNRILLADQINRLRRGDQG